MATNNTTTGICKHCDREMNIVGRGLCGKCYHALKREAQLDELFPTKRKASAVPKVTRERKPKAKTEKPLEELTTPTLAGDMSDEASAIEFVYLGLAPLDPESRQDVIEFVMKRLARGTTDGGK